MTMYLEDLNAYGADYFHNKIPLPVVMHMGDRLDPPEATRRVICRFGPTICHKCARRTGDIDFRWYTDRWVERYPKLAIEAESRRMLRNEAAEHSLGFEGAFPKMPEHLLEYQQPTIRLRSQLALDLYMRDCAIVMTPIEYENNVHCTWCARPTTNGCMKCAPANLEARGGAVCTVCWRFWRECLDCFCTFRGARKEEARRLLAAQILGPP